MTEHKPKPKQHRVHDVHRLGGKFKRIGARAVQKARAENRRLGVPNVSGRDGVIYYELPDGTVTTTSPFPRRRPPASG